MCELFGAELDTGRGVAIVVSRSPIEMKMMLVEYWRWVNDDASKILLCCFNNACTMSLFCL